MNRTIIIGNLTRDPETRTTNAGKTVCGFTVAVNRRRKVEGQPEADFFRVSAFEKLGESCQKYLTKGKKVCVTGQISTHAFKGNDGEPKATLELLAEDVEFLSPAGNGGEQASAPAPDTANGYTSADSESLPF